MIRFIFLFFICLAWAIPAVNAQDQGNCPPLAEVAAPATLRQLFEAMALHQVTPKEFCDEGAVAFDLYRLQKLGNPLYHSRAETREKMKDVLEEFPQQHKAPHWAMKIEGAPIAFPPYPPVQEAAERILKARKELFSFLIIKNRGKFTRLWRAKMGDDFVDKVISSEGFLARLENEHENDPDGNLGLILERVQKDVDLTRLTVAQKIFLKNLTLISKLTGPLSDALKSGSSIQQMNALDDLYQDAKYAFGSHYDKLYLDHETLKFVHPHTPFEPWPAIAAEEEKEVHAHLLYPVGEALNKLRQDTKIYYQKFLRGETKASGSGDKKKYSYTLRPLTHWESIYRGQAGSSNGNNDCSTRSYPWSALQKNYITFTLTDGEYHSHGQITLALGKAANRKNERIKVAFLDKIQGLALEEIPVALEALRKIMEKEGMPLVLPRELGDHNGVTNQKEVENFLQLLYSPEATVATGYKTFRPFKVEGLFENLYSRAYEKLDADAVAPIVHTGMTFTFKSPEKAKVFKSIFLPPLMKEATNLKKGSDKDRISYLSIQEQLMRIPGGDKWIDPDLLPTLSGWMRSPVVGQELKKAILGHYFHLRAVHKILEEITYLPEELQAGLLNDWYQSPMGKAILFSSESKDLRKKFDLSWMELIKRRPFLITEAVRVYLQGKPKKKRVRVGDEEEGPTDFDSDDGVEVDPELSYSFVTNPYAVDTLDKKAIRRDIWSTFAVTDPHAAHFLLEMAKQSDDVRDWEEVQRRLADLRAQASPKDEAQIREIEKVLMEKNLDPTLVPYPGKIKAAKAPVLLPDGTEVIINAKGVLSWLEGKKVIGEVPFTDSVKGSIKALGKDGVVFISEDKSKNRKLVVIRRDGKQVKVEREFPLDKDKKETRHLYDTQVLSVDGAGRILLANPLQGHFALVKVPADGSRPNLETILATLPTYGSTTSAPRFLGDGSILYSSAQEETLTLLASDGRQLKKFPLAGVQNRVPLDLGDGHLLVSVDETKLALVKVSANAREEDMIQNAFTLELSSKMAHGVETFLLPDGNILAVTEKALVWLRREGDKLVQVHQYLNRPGSYNQFTINHNPPVILRDGTVVIQKDFDGKYFQWVRDGKKLGEMTVPSGNSDILVPENQLQRWGGTDDQFRPEGAPLSMKTKRGVMEILPPRKFLSNK